MVFRLGELWWMISKGVSSMRVAHNLAKLSSCFSLCLLLITRAKRGERSREEFEVEQKRRRRRRRGKGEAFAAKDEMDDLIGSMPVVLQQPEMVDEELEGRVWGALPDELVDRVLACLPVPLLLQFRSVCKRWKSLITSAPFLNLRAGAPYSGLHFLVFEFQKPESWGAYNPSLHKWYTVPLAALQGAIVISMASDGGLLCMVTRSSWYAGPTRILLCNPVTQCLRELPMTWVCSQTSTWIPSLVVLVVDQEKNSFKVVAAGFKGSPHEPTCLCRVTEVYDSVSNRWETTGNLPWTCIEFDFPSHVVCRGHIYCLATYLGDLRVVAYDLEGKVWNVIPLQMPNLRGSQVLLFERRGILVLVQQAARMIGVPEIYTWEPGSHSDREWTTVRRILPRLGKKFEELFQFDTELAWGGKGDIIFFVSHKWDRALLYDMSQMSWTITPMSKFLKPEHYALMAIPFDFNLQLLSD